MQKVGFEGHHDPDVGRLFSPKKKFLVTLVIYYATLPVLANLSLLSGAFKQVESHFGVSRITAEITQTLHLVGFGIGGIFGGPISEFLGRKLLTLISGFLGISFAFGSGASQSFAALAILRFFSGVAGAMQVIVLSAMLVDLHGGPNYIFLKSIFLATVSMLPPFATAIGFYISVSSLRWRYTEYIIGIFLCTSFVLLLFVPETYGPYNLKKKAERLRCETGNFSLHANLELKKASAKFFIMEFFLKPLKLVFTEPLLFSITLYLSMAFLTLFLSNSGLALAFEKRRDYNSYQTSLVYIAFGCGALVGGILGLAYLMPIATRDYKRTGSQLFAKPCVNLMCFGSVINPIGLFFTAWFSERKFIWVLPVMGVFLTAAGTTISYIYASIIVSRFYAKYVGSAFAAILLIYALSASSGPVLIFPIINNLTVQWGYTLIGLISSAVGIIPFVIRIKIDKLIRVSKRLREANADAYIPSED